MEQLRMKKFQPDDKPDGMVTGEIFGARLLGMTLGTPGTPGEETIKRPEDAIYKSSPIDYRRPHRPAYGIAPAVIAALPAGSFEHEAQRIFIVAVDCHLS